VCKTQASSVRFSSHRASSTTFTLRDCVPPTGPEGASQGRLRLRVVTVIDLLPITIVDGSRGLHTAGVPVASSPWSCSSFRSQLSLGGGTGNGSSISLRPSLFTEHHFVSNLNDRARDVAPRSTGLIPELRNGQTPTPVAERWFRCARSAPNGAGATPMRTSACTGFTMTSTSSISCRYLRANTPAHA
jgi:hypothetical protein